MRFEGEAVLAVLRNQTQPVQICDSAGVPFMTVIPAAIYDASLPRDERLDPIADSLRVGGFFAIGNKKRIRRIQAKNPSVWGVGWRGGSHTTQRIRNEQGEIVAPDFHVEHKPVLNN